MGLSTRTDTDTSNRTIGTLRKNVVVMVCVLTLVTLSLISKFFRTSLLAQLDSFLATSAKIITNEIAPKGLLLLSYPQKMPLPAGRPAKSPGYRAFWLVASIKKNVAITVIPKVMCSSIRHSLSMFECGGTSRCSEARKKWKD
jgi:hypothetical protein